VPAPYSTPPRPAPQPEPDTAYAIDSTHADSETDNLIAVFGSASRKGRWRIRKHTNAFALFGGIDIDLNEAVFEAPEVVISGAWCFGALDIKAPEGIEVRDQTVGIFGGTDVSNLGEPRPGAPVVILKGFTLFGGVSVKGPKPNKKRRHGLH
jgi:hypothetical protein